jgi:hypothetical protein
LIRSAPFLDSDSVASMLVVNSISLRNSSLSDASVDSPTPEAPSSQGLGVGLWIGVGALVLVIGVGLFAIILFLRRSRKSDSTGWENETTQSPQWQTECIDGCVSNVNTLGKDGVLELPII